MNYICMDIIIAYHKENYKHFLKGF